MSWQGQFGDLIESLEFYETDEKRGFVRGARWGLAPTGGPVNAALPRAPASRSGARTTTCTSRRSWATARTGASSPRTCPTRPTTSRCRRTVTDSRRHPRAGSPLHDGRQRAAHARLPHRARQGVDGRGGRVQDRGRSADALQRLAPAGHGAHGRRPEDVRARPLEPRARRPEPVRRRRLVLRDVERRQPDLDDRRDRAARRRPHGRDALQPAGRRRRLHERLATPTDERATFAAVADQLHSGRARNAVGRAKSSTTTGSSSSCVRGRTSPSR